MKKRARPRRGDWYTIPADCNGVDADVVYLVSSHCGHVYLDSDDEEEDVVIVLSPGDMLLFIDEKKELIKMAGGTREMIGHALLKGHIVEIDQNDITCKWITPAL